MWDISILNLVNTLFSTHFNPSHLHKKSQNKTHLNNPVADDERENVRVMNNQRNALGLF